MRVPSVGHVGHQFHAAGFQNFKQRFLPGRHDRFSLMGPSTCELKLPIIDLHPFGEAQHCRASNALASMFKTGQQRDFNRCASTPRRRPAALRR